MTKNVEALTTPEKKLAKSAKQVEDLREAFSVVEASMQAQIEAQERTKRSTIQATCKGKRRGPHVDNGGLLAVQEVRLSDDRGLQHRL